MALQILYEIDCTEHRPGDVITVRLREEGESDDPPDEAVEAYVTRLVTGVLKFRETLDDLIRSHAPEWPLSQMAIIDRNVLRMAIFEMLASDETPTKVAINEAVELSKLYGSDSTPRFVNGVLGTLAAKQVQILEAFRKTTAGHEEQG